jgi:hypothetical protein
VKPWFAGRIADAPRVIDLASGLPAGRRARRRRRPRQVPTLVYRRREHLINLTAVLPGTPPRRRAATARTASTSSPGPRTAWLEAVSDVMTSDLLEFMHQFSTQD